VESPQDTRSEPKKEVSPRNPRSGYRFTAVSQLITFGELGQHQIRFPFFEATENEVFTAGPSTALRSGRDDNSFVTLTFPVLNRCSFLPQLAAGK
jgi:hypothetical protein